MRTRTSSTEIRLSPADIQAQLLRRLWQLLSPSLSNDRRAPFEIRSLRTGIADLISRFRHSGYSAYLIGGLLRDLVGTPVPSRPRDVDIVVDCPRNSDLEPILSDLPHQHNRFGGVRVINAISYDIWALPETWAFTKGLVPARLENLPQTSFLNLDGIVAALEAPSEGKRQLFANGFFDGIAQRVVELNFELNPFPALCVVRSIAIASQLNFSIGPRLARYLIDALDSTSASEIERAQYAHYGSLRYTARQIFNSIESIAKQTEQSTTSNLPGSTRAQYDMWV